MRSVHVPTYPCFRAGIGRTSRLRVHTLARDEGGVLDEPATTQALAAFLLRGVHCGAVRAEGVADLTGTDLDTVGWAGLGWAGLGARRVG